MDSWLAAYIILPPDVAKLHQLQCTYTHYFTCFTISFCHKQLILGPSAKQRRLQDYSYIACKPGSSLSQRALLLNALSYASPISHFRQLSFPISSSLIPDFTSSQIDRGGRRLTSMGSPQAIMLLVGARVAVCCSE